jgi:hypothetical protein
MYKFQDDYYEEEACDPYYEDCPEACDPYYEECDEAAEEDYEEEYAAEEAAECDPEMDEDCEMMEEAKSPLLLLWGLSPILDLTAGFWNNDKMGDSNLDEWDQLVLAELITGGLGFVFWAGATFMGAPFSSLFVLTSKLHILLEATNIFLTYRAWDKWSTGLKDSQKFFGYGSHVFGVLIGVAAMSAIDAEYKVAACDPEMEDCEEMDEDEEADEEADYEEEAEPCDPYYEDCEAAEEEECDPYYEDCYGNEEYN